MKVEVCSGVRRVVVAGGIPVDRDPAERQAGRGVDRDVQDPLLVADAFVVSVAAIPVEIEAAASCVGHRRELLERAG
jgi:hypothetical protein